VAYLLVLYLTSLALAYELRFTEATRHIGRALSSTGSRTGFQDAITPPASSYVAFAVYGLGVADARARHAQEPPAAAHRPGHRLALPHGAEERAQGITVHTATRSAYLRTGVKEVLARFAGPGGPGDHAASGESGGLGVRSGCWGCDHDMLVAERGQKTTSISTSTMATSWSRSREPRGGSQDQGGVAIVAPRGDQAPRRHGPGAGWRVDHGNGGWGNGRAGSPAYGPCNMCQPEKRWPELSPEALCPVPPPCRDRAS
jgi:hypothetical protein